ncbi:MAG: hypothetical protein M3Y55_18835 [Pseudomonadota bacterium]|nr:hypothetical protein [Pseudomonadota bacterium]
MTDDRFPFDPERLADLTASSRTHTGSVPFAPIGTPVVVDERGYAWLPGPYGSGCKIGSYVHAGVRMGWTPVPELHGLLLIQLGGRASDSAFEEEGLTAFLTRDGLRRLIVDLQSIDAQLGDQP